MNLLKLITKDGWITRLITNHIGYIVFAIPIAILFLISKKFDYTTWPQPIRWFISPLIFLFVSNPSKSSLSGVIPLTDQSISSSSSSSDFTHRHSLKLIFSLICLLITHLLAGLLQERIMTRPYVNEKFTNSQFLIFINRLLPMIIAYILLKIFHPKENLLFMRPPLYQYGLVSYTKCMSTWFQYESLLYISFPIQVISKSIRTIPVMIIGKFVSGETYTLKQYLLMFIMASGVALFLSGFHENSINKLPSKNTKHSTTTINGIILLLCYLIFDAFTSNYQKHIFNQYSISFLNMMFYVNFFSAILTLTSLIFNGTLYQSLLFMHRHQSFVIHVFTVSMCSSVGQLLVFSILKEFGVVILTIIITIRQAFSILLSCFIYGHQVNWISIIGLHIAFLAIFILAFIQLKKRK